MKLIFLDIDGVANSARSVVAKIGPTKFTSELVRELSKIDEPDEPDSPYAVRHALETVDPICVELINRLLDNEDIGLVLSSSHRSYLTRTHITYGSAGHIARLRQYLTAMGFRVPAFLSITSQNQTTRGKQVEEFLNMAYENGLIDDNDPYVILDDSRDFESYQALVHCDASVGFDFPNYVEATKHLGLKEPSVILL